MPIQLNSEMGGFEKVAGTTSRIGSRRKEFHSLLVLLKLSLTFFHALSAIVCVGPMEILLSRYCFVLGNLYYIRTIILDTYSCLGGKPVSFQFVRYLDFLLFLVLSSSARHHQSALYVQGSCVKQIWQALCSQNLFSPQHYLRAPNRF